MSGSGQLAAAAGTCWLVVEEEEGGVGGAGGGRGAFTGEQTEMEQEQLQ